MALINLSFQLLIILLNNINNNNNNNKNNMAILCTIYNKSCTTFMRVYYFRI